MSRFDFTREAETPKKKHGPTKRTNARKFQMCLWEQGDKLKAT